MSLFSGCGGLDLGMKRAGFDVAVATDFDDRCAESHKVNFEETNFVHIGIEDLTREHLEPAATEGVDLLVGGPPCPPFSKSRFYLKDKPRGFADPVGGATVRGYIRVLEELRPRAFLLENVPGFQYKVHAAALDHILREAHRLGYTTNYGVLNAADYGVPQIRQRFFLVGSLEGPITMPSPTHAKDPEASLEDIRPWVTAGDAIGDLDTEENADDTGHFAGGKHHELLVQVPPGDNYLYFTAKRGHPKPEFEWRSRYWSFLLKLSPEMPSWTIQAKRSNNMGPFHWRNRILRIEEIKRLQTFPDDWHLAGRIEDQWRQVGNAVPPLLAEHLGRQIHNHLSAA